ncbi:invasion associated locus B family protein [Primorskyibacter sp. S87]|uniref:invasion associated locus B family protein n=1 Tax=Primorskyibacter sp. S87 TaxID=3415126 RepID=UPI003C7C0C81
MIRHLTSFAIATALAMTPAIAQETTSEEPQQADQVLDMGQAVPEGPKLGERYATQKFGDWNLACIKTEGPEDPCSLLQILNDQAGNQIAEISLFRLENGGQAVAGATVIVPLETLLPAQLTISVDGAPGKRYAYSFCNPIGCIAQLGLTEQDIEAFKKGSEATVSLVPAPAPDQTVELKLSLQGFTAGYDIVDVVKN